MPNTLYVLGAPAGDPADLSLRAKRILSEVHCIVAYDLQWARHQLAGLDLHAPLLVATDLVAIWEALDRGDVAFLSGEVVPGASRADPALIRAALSRGIPVVPVPGPVLPLTALVVSGLPADSFVYLGELPDQAAARRSLIEAVASDRRTLIAVETAGGLADTLVDLHGAFGDRPVVVLAASAPQPGWIWRGTLAAAATEGPPGMLPGRCALVVGGARIEEPAWDEEQVRAEVAACLKRGLRTKEIAQELPARSGWSRREIYRLALEQRRSLANHGKET